MPCPIEFMGRMDILPGHGRLQSEEGSAEDIDFLHILSLHTRCEQDMFLGCERPTCKGGISVSVCPIHACATHLARRTVDWLLSDGLPEPGCQAQRSHYKIEYTRKMDKMLNGGNDSV